MLKASGKASQEWVVDVCEGGKIPKDWSKSWLASVYKGREMTVDQTEALKCWNIY